MLMVILSISALILAAVLAKRSMFPKPMLDRLLKASLVIFALLGFLSRSFVIVDGDEIGALKRIYFGDQLPPGRIIALDGQKGPQADILGPGFHLRLFVRVLYDVEYYPVQEIPEGQYGLLLTNDGSPIDEGAYLANPWAEGEEEKMLDATYFLQNGGQKGPQFNVLKPGKYRMNPYLFRIKKLAATDVPTGNVAVIRSNVQTASGDCPDPAVTVGIADKEVALPLVPKGCVGVWELPVPPGRYYLNEKAFVTTIIPTRLQTWVYKGGYTSRRINLTVSDEGKITQKEISEIIKVPKDAADKAINVRVEGWTVPVDMRIVVAVNPAHAAKVVASVGGLKQVEDNIITPAIRDILRTIGGQPGRKVLDFIEKRGEIVAEVERAIVPEGLKAGVTIQEVRMGEPAIPPELLVATLREQLAIQLQATYKKEQDAQRERIKVERERATADQQKTLVAAEIQKKAAEFTKEQLRLLGEGEKLKLLEIAKGQEAQALVLGKDAALQLAALEKVLEAAKENDRIVKVPSVLVITSGEGSLEGAAAVLGSSNIFRSLQGIGGKQAE